jgi:mono/diheme cytochrome c family protein
MHFNKRKIYILLICISIIAWSCKSSLYTPEAVHVTSGTTLEELTEGRKLYINNCSSCHALHAPGAFTHEKWKTEMSEMQQRAEIDDYTAELILNYLWNAPVSKH